MWWIPFALLQLLAIVSGIRQEQHAGLWSWSKFVFTLSFAALELLILLVPLYLVDLRDPRFPAIMGGAGILAALNFIWMIIVARRWRLPDGRTSLQAYRDDHPKK